jgi:hypothetical protein
VEVLNFPPSLVIDVVYNNLSSLVNAQSDDSHVTTPLSLFGLKHLLVVFHWSLAWWAPGSPEINQPSLSIMFKTNLIVAVDGSDALDGAVLHSSGDSAGKADRDSLYSISEGLDLCIECLHIGLQ